MTLGAGGHWHLHIILKRFLPQMHGQQVWTEVDSKDVSCVVETWVQTPVETEFASTTSAGVITQIT